MKSGKTQKCASCGSNNTETSVISEDEFFRFFKSFIISKKLMIKCRECGEISFEDFYLLPKPLCRILMNGKQFVFLLILAAALAAILFQLFFIFARFIV